MEVLVPDQENKNHIVKINKKSYIIGVNINYAYSNNNLNHFELLIKINKLILNIKQTKKIGDWGLGQIPNPQYNSY